MRSTWFAVMFAVAIGCTKPNPEVCCATTEQCDALGVSDLRPCDQGQACRDFKCVAAECVANADCDMASPICSHGLCVSTCFDDTDCMDVAGRPHCTPGGECVGCVLDAQCPTSEHICDPATQTCRGCDRDDECESGVCIEASGSCAADSEIVYVSTSGQDSGTCSKTAPCETFGFALGKVSLTRPIVRILSSSYAVGTTTEIDRSVIVDGTRGTQLALPGTPSLDINVAAVLTIDSVRITGGAGSKSIVANASSSVRLFGAQLEQVSVEVKNSSLELTHAELSGSAVTCTNGAVTITDSLFDESPVSFSSCQVTARANRWDPISTAFDGAGGLFVVENNIFVVPSEFADLIHAFGVTPGSRFAFNTVVNTSSVQMSPVAVSCDSTLDVTSNIIAYNSSDPLYPGCVAHDSLFDSAGASDAPGNASGDSRTFFVDKSGGDFHPSPASPALGIGQAGVVTSDFDGKSRPQPAGSRPDVGAYEAP